MPRWIWLTGIVSGRDVALPARADFSPWGNEASRPIAASARSEEVWRKGRESTIKAPDGQGRFLQGLLGERSARELRGPQPGSPFWKGRTLEPGRPLNVPKKRLCWRPLGLRPACPDKRHGRPAPGRPCHACHRSPAPEPLVARFGGVADTTARRLLGIRGATTRTCHALGDDARYLLGERDRGSTVKVMA